MHLPDIGGYEVCRRLKADRELAAIPVIYLTATSEEAEVAAATRETAANGYLTEPLRPDELLESVAAVLVMGPEPE